MMKWVMMALIVFSVIFSLITGRISEVSTAFLSECESAVALAISLIGIICLWSGVMRVAQKSGVTEILAKLFSPILGRLFKGLKQKGKALGYIILNLTANILGLGNASTPFGLMAMKEIEAEENSPNPENASNNMIVFTVMNTASLQLIPTTVAALRLKAGSQNPMEILPCVWIVSVLALTSALIGTKLFKKLWEVMKK